MKIGDYFARSSIEKLSLRQYELLRIYLRFIGFEILDGYGDHSTPCGNALRLTGVGLLWSEVTERYVGSKIPEDDLMKMIEMGSLCE